MAVEALMNNPQGAMPMEQGAPMQAPTEGGGQPQPLNINPQEFQNAIQNLSPAAIQALDMHLTPSVKQALAELLGPAVVEVVQDIGPAEPTISLPVSVIASAFPADSIEESIQMMEQDLRSKVQTDIPSSPQGGLGGAPEGAPQTNVPPMPMA
jgi:hypothetical protein|tara:strand:- start:44 stop:502 length:459 start_codon:yes stop_codon:yes gene_type:complete